MTLSSQSKAVLQIHFHHRPGPELYEQLLELLQGLTPRVQALPPDAAVLDITGALRFFDQDAYGLAQVARLRALALHGVQSTAAVGPNRMLAAMAAAATPPGRTIALDPDPDAITAWLRPRPVTALPGVGPATAQTLNRFGLRTIADLADTPLSTLQRILGTGTARTLSTRAHGIDTTPLLPHGTSPSTTAERRFTQDELDPAQHRRALLALTEQLGARLRSAGQVCRALVLTVRYADGGTTSRTRALTEPTAHTPILTDAAYALHTGLNLQRARVRSLALRAEGLALAETASRQLFLDLREDKARWLEAAADRARARFGPQAVHPAPLAFQARRAPRRDMV